MLPEKVSIQLSSEQFIGDIWIVQLDWLKYQPKDGDALQLGSKGRYGSCVGGHI